MPTPRTFLLCLTVALPTALAGLAFPPAAFAQSGERDHLLVSADWLAENIGDPGLVLLHVGAKEDYLQEHIPGAHYVERDQMSAPGSHEAGSLVLELPEPEAFQAALRSYGVAADSRIVVYWGSESVTPTARVVFTLDWAGQGDRTVLLDGGLGAWKQAGGAVTADLPAEGNGTVQIDPRSGLVVDAAWVQEHMDGTGYALVDGRAPVFFDGLREDQGKSGHLPGAGNLPWTELVDESLHLKGADELRALFSAAGVEPGDTVVGYCHIGQFATLVLFAARTLGHEVVLYDGAFQDWAGRDLPVEGAGN